MAKIISASRRTDIPAFHTQWFVERIHEGSVTWRNPFGGQFIETSLLPQDVAAIVFWSKDYSPLLPYLPGLYDNGYRFLFHYTITGLPSIFEPAVGDVTTSVQTARTLANMFGSEAVLWRYDPALISSITPPQYHISRFAELAKMMRGLCSRCFISFPTFYGKVVRRVAKLNRETGIECVDPPVEQKLELAKQLTAIAAESGIDMHSCCCDYLVSGTISKGHCVDAELLARLYPDRDFHLKLKGTRAQCGCYESTDIGSYNSCAHGCVYCYANR